MCAIPTLENNREELIKNIHAKIFSCIELNPQIEAGYIDLDFSVYSKEYLSKQLEEYLDEMGDEVIQEF